VASTPPSSPVDVDSQADVGAPATPAGATSVKVLVPGEHAMVSLLGTRDELLRIVEEAFQARIHVRGNEISVSAEDAAETDRVAHLFEELVLLLDRGQHIDQAMVRQTIRMIRSDDDERPSDVLSEALITHRGRTIRPKTLGQKRYLDAIKASTVTFGIGPAGTGKTYLAMGAAVQALRSKQVNRLILTRPAVEAGERLGFLPGTLHEKIDPYLKPLWDALHDMMEAEELIAHVDRGTIEVAPLAYMRGRAQPVFAEVLTPTGYRPIGELAVGDHVIGSDGQPTQVRGVYPQGRKETFRVTAQDGATTLCTADHLWAVHTREHRRRWTEPRVLTTRDLMDQIWAGHHHRFELPLLRRPVHFQPRDVPIDAYALGLLLGDGCRTAPSFATQGTEFAAMHDDVRNRAGGGAVVVSQATAVLPELELGDTGSGTRLVPECYLYNAADVRLAVLQGLLDTDGEAVTHADRTCRIHYATTSARLRDDVLFLVRSLGGVADGSTRAASGRTTPRASGREVDRTDAHFLDIHLPGGMEPFRLPRKQALYRRIGGGRPARWLHSIEPAGTEEAVCIRVAAPDSLYVTEDFLLTHNTLNDAFIVADEAQNTTAEQMKMFLTRIGFNSKAVVTGDISQVDLPAGKRSGLRIVRDILTGIEGVSFCYLTAGDVVRHHIVQRIVEAYEAYDEEQERDAEGRTGASPGDGER